MTESDRYTVPAPGDAALSAREALDLARAKLAQDRDLKERELALKEREIELHRGQGWRERLSSPAVVAIVAGLIGYIGTLISSYQNRQLERDKQEATLILEAIKTSGTAEEKERQTAANLVFLADAGLITTIKTAQMEKLRVKAQGAGPSLPAPQAIDFKRSSSLTSDLEAMLETALRDYQLSLARIGYDPAQARERVTVRVDEEVRDNAYFELENNSVVLSSTLARDPEYALSEYTWHILRQSNRLAFEAFWESPSAQFQGFGQGLKFYFTCSHLNDPRVGRNYVALTSAGTAEQRRQGYVYNLDNSRIFDKNGGPNMLEIHNLGEIWGGAFWELRKKLGRESADRIVFAAWKQFRPIHGSLPTPELFVDTVIEASKVVPGQDPELVRQAFARRRLI